MKSLPRFPVFLLLAAAPLAAQDNYEVQVYGSDLVPVAHTMVEVHSNYLLSGSPPAAGLAITEHALHETLEVTHGFSEWVEVGFYLFTSSHSGEGFSLVGTHVRPRIAVPARLGWPVGVSLSQEIGYQRAEYSPDTWTWEIRPIVDQHVGRFYWSFNPTVEVALKGPSAGSAPEFSPNAQLAFDLLPRVNVALEYYGGFGPIGDFPTLSQTGQMLMPAVNLDLGPEWEFNLGLGLGVTDATDGPLLKMIVGRRLGGRPQVDH